MKGDSLAVPPPAGEPPGRPAQRANNLGRTQVRRIFTHYTTIGARYSPKTFRSTSAISPRVA